MSRIHTDRPANSTVQNVTKSDAIGEEGESDWFLTLCITRF
jgi:hypothetical protein